MSDGVRSNFEMKMGCYAECPSGLVALELRSINGHAYQTSEKPLKMGATLT